MKICSKCKEEKPFSLFYRRNRTLDGYQSTCKVCADIASNKCRTGEQKPKYDQYRASYKDKMNTLVNGWKSTIGCRCCTERDPCCLELHHLDPNAKENHPSLMKTSWDRFVREAVKCVLVCANCHRKIHAGKIIVDETHLCLYTSFIEPI